MKFTGNNSIKLEIWGDKKYSINQVTVSELTKFKNQIVDSAIRAVNS